MATVRRIGFGTIFELEDSKVGIGTDAATHTLQVLGNIRSEDATDICLLYTSPSPRDS